MKDTYHVRKRNGTSVLMTDDLAEARTAAKAEGAQLYKIVEGRQYLQPLPTVRGEDDDDKRKRVNQNGAQNTRS